jgi:hypothetical protein
MQSCMSNNAPAQLRSYSPKVRHRYAFRPIESVSCKTHHICTPQKPLPPATPNPPAVGDQLKFETSNPHSHTAFGPLSVPVALGAGCPPARSHSRTQQSSPPLASTPRSLALHSMALTFAPWPRNSRRAWPGCRTSRTRIREESWEKVARR